MLTGSRIPSAHVARSPCTTCQLVMTTCSHHVPVVCRLAGCTAKCEFINPDPPGEFRWPETSRPPVDAAHVNWFTVLRLSMTPAVWDEDVLASLTMAPPPDGTSDMARSICNPTPGACPTDQPDCETRPRPVRVVSTGLRCLAGTGRTGFMAVAPNDYPFYGDDEKYVPIMQADGGQLSGAARTDTVHSDTWISSVNMAAMRLDFSVASQNGCLCIILPHSRQR